MKKAMLLLLCLTIFLLAVSCDNKTSKETLFNDNSTDEMQSIQKTSDNGNEQQVNDNSIDNNTGVSVDYSNLNNLPQSYLQVIRGEKTFLFTGEEVLIGNYKFPYYQKYLTQCDNVQYAVTDMDRDGKIEILIRGWTDDVLVLHEENGSIYGFDFTFREMDDVRTDGSYCWHDNQGNTYGYSKLSFKNGTCSVVELCRTELDGKGVAHFFINGEEVAKDKYDSFAELFFNTDNVDWYKLSIFSKNVEDKG